MSWISVKLTAPGPLVETLTEAFERFGAVAVLHLDGGDEAILEPDPGATPIWSTSRVQALLDPETDISGLRGALAEAFEAEGSSFPGCDVDFVDSDDWEAQWKQYAVHRNFGDRLWLVPRGEFPEEAKAEAAIVELDPGLAFGTGGHPTTALCLEALASLDVLDKRVLDFGCGSGVLAIAALKLGARSALGVDHDPQALLASVENAEHNGVAHRLTLTESLGDEPAFDVLLANVLANPLIELAPMLTSALLPGGSVVLSGLLIEQVESVIAAWPDIDFDPALLSEEWAALVGVRRGGTSG